MNRPKPASATYAANVAVATTCTAAEPTPPIITGLASGSSTPRTICHSDMPSARAAFTAVTSTFATPEYAPANKGGIASTTNTITGAFKPIPIKRPSSVSKPRVGTALAAPAIAATTPCPLRVCPTATPAGRATALAINSTNSAIAKCWPRRTQIPDAPNQLPGSATHASASTNKFIVRPPHRPAHPASRPQPPAAPARAAPPSSTGTVANQPTPSEHPTRAPAQS